MSQDFKTYQAMTIAPTTLEVPSVNPKTDFEELSVLGASQGLGQPIYDDGDADDTDFRDTLIEFGIRPSGSE